MEVASKHLISFLDYSLCISLLLLMIDILDYWLIERVGQLIGF